MKAENIIFLIQRGISGPAIGDGCVSKCTARIHGLKTVVLRLFKL